jgi:hypothetical protein
VIAENLQKDPIITYVDELNQHIVEDPLHFEGVHGEPEEWTNIPQLIARFLIRNQQHLIALIQHNKHVSNSETTADLRRFTEVEIKNTHIKVDKNKGIFDDFVGKNADEHKRIQEYAERVDYDLARFKNYCDDMK